MRRIGAVAEFYVFISQALIFMTPPHAYLQLVLCYLSSICFMADGVCGATRSGLRLTYSRRVSAENTDPGLQKHVC